MVFFNWATMQMAAKIVYYGPGLCGKTSNLSYIYSKTSPNSRGEMVSLETESDRTLFFDLLPIEVGTIGGFKTRLQLYTVPGQVFYNTTRKLVLKGVDGLVFVADSQRPMNEANLESFASLKDNLAELGLDLNDLPVVLQYNKRDLKNILTVEEMNESLNPDDAFPFFESSAIEGTGVFETLKAITKITLKKLRKRMAAPQESAAPKPRLTTAPPKTTKEPSKKPMTVSASALARAAEEGVDDGQEGAAAQAPKAEPRAAAQAEQSQPAFSRPLDHTDPGPAFASTKKQPPEKAPEAAQPTPAPTPQPPSTQAPTPAGELEEVPFHDEEPPFSVGPELEAKKEQKPEEVADSPEAEAISTNGNGFPEAIEFEPSGEDIELIPERVTDDDLEEVEEIEAADEVESVVEIEDVAEASPEPEASPANPESEAPPASPEVEAAPEVNGGEKSDSEMQVEFDQTGVDIQPPPMKRVQVSNQLDILAELDGLRKQATMKPESVRGAASGQKKNLDLDSLLGNGSSSPKKNEVRKRLAESVPPAVLAQMQSLQMAIRIQGDGGEVIHTLNPIVVEIEEHKNDTRVSVQLSIDLDSKN